MSPFTLDPPRHALVTGAGRGLGRAMALALADLGCPVTVNYLRNREAAEAVVGEIVRRGGAAVALAADVADPQQAAALVTAARAALGPVGILVNNAGIGNARPVFENTVEDFDATFAANVRSAFIVTQEVLPDMREMEFGRLVFLSSIAAVNGGVISTPYAASKAALVGMMHHYAASLMRWKITANALAPAFIETDMLAGVPLPPPESMPLGRMGRPEEVGTLCQAIVACGFMTGQTLHVSAGRYMT
ncbi:SDR family NAD(P)-dependent oxidoreductase [Chelatococcus asaccharovorans]|uniref:SDR family NAD(P)-dependent oxidoreductase n=1 Tax=Chelatococcus asaccharovorans TaxID=28210 RepID=UPI00224C7B4E|nr:SDR family NAD(P)-dependent oxidoreductase [Chelatococcus asaccharovorans]CAH1666292.1 3-oxoacyl-(acyl-carrier protein) reductase [Chelatococcus asaccharovorans]CAH1681551.1 3-oxoacyl-(acyl-carrier protein) reductase [Chelatococcus asaccharovorans]